MSLKTKDNTISLKERLARFIIWFGPRSFGLLYVILLSVGINLLTSLTDLSSGSVVKLILAAAATLAGVAFFIVSSSIEVCFESAKEVQRMQLEEKQKESGVSVANAGDLAADNLQNNLARLIVTTAALCMGTILFALVIIIPIVEFSVRRPTTTSQSTAPLSTEGEKPSETPKPTPSATITSSNQSHAPTSNRNSPNQVSDSSGQSKKNRIKKSEH